MISSALKSTTLSTPLGPMIAIANQEVLLCLEFMERRHLDQHLKRLQERLNMTMTPGVTFPIASIQRELSAYFKGALDAFKTPLLQFGTPFQKKAWSTLAQIPYGETRSYLEQANMLEKPAATRAVANANGANQLAIVIPCHRVIRTDGTLGGYAAGIARKQWLINHERQTRLRLGS